MQDLSVRRHHEQRLKIRWAKRLSRDRETFTARDVGRRIHTAALCSCHMCGNARKHFHRRTFKEALHFLELSEGLSEL